MLDTLRLPLLFFSASFSSHLFVLSHFFRSLLAFATITLKPIFLSLLDIHKELIPNSSSLSDVSPLDFKTAEFHRVPTKCSDLPLVIIDMSGSLLCFTKLGESTQVRLGGFAWRTHVLSFAGERVELSFYASISCINHKKLLLIF